MASAPVAATSASEIDSSSDEPPQPNVNSATASSPTATTRISAMRSALHGSGRCTVGLGQVTRLRDYGRDMGRNYSDPTIKTLFAEASGCAWPGCERALILWDRGVTRSSCRLLISARRSCTVLGTIPRSGAILTGRTTCCCSAATYHPPVDRHESLYSIEELDEWKRAATRCGRRRDADHCRPDS